MAFTVASLTTCRRQLIGLLNAAGWTNISDGGITSAAAVLTTTASIFVATDVGKTIAVLGAGAAGVTLTTTISAYTSATQVTLAANAGTTVTNASVSFGGRFDDDKFAIQLIEESLSEGDERYYVAIAETKGHWARPDIMVESSDITTNGSEIAAHVGEVGEVTIKYVSGDSDYKLGKPVAREEIEMWLRNTDTTWPVAHSATGTVTAGYYDPVALADGIAYFTGNAFRIRLASYTRTAALQSPEAYTGGIVAHAASNMFTFDGLDTDAAMFHAKEADAWEAAVRRGSK